MRLTFISLEDSQDIVRVLGNTTNSAYSDFLKMNDAYCVSTESANYLLNDKGHNSALNLLSVSRSEQVGINIHEEIFSGDDDDDDVLVLDTDEDLLHEMDEILNTRWFKYDRD
jgi:hypothetical protein